jgi:hypothetical protein
VEKLDLEFRDWPPDYANPDGNNFIIYCDMYGWSTDGRVWSAPSGTVTFTDEEAGRKGDLCFTNVGPRALATTLKGKEFKIPLIFLCDILRPPDGQKTNMAYPFRYSTLHNYGMLGYGRYFDEQMRNTVSMVLVHEMMHVAQNRLSQYRSFWSKG